MQKAEGMKLLSIVTFVLTAMSGAILATLLVSPWIFGYVIDFARLTEQSGLNRDQLAQSYQEIVTYLIQPNGRPFSLTYFSSSPQGVQHFADVKMLFFYAFLVFLLTFIACFFLLAYLRKRKQRRKMENHFKIAAILPLILMAVAVVTFEQAFILFHRLFFRNDYWLFDPTLDPVITILPETFFMALFILGIIIYELILGIFALILKK